MPPAPTMDARPRHKNLAKPTRPNTGRRPTPPPVTPGVGSARPPPPRGDYRWVNNPVTFFNPAPPNPPSPAG